MKKYLNTVLVRFCGLTLLVCLGCAAQSNTPDLDRQIVRQIRGYYDNIPPQVNIEISPRQPSSEFPGYEAFNVTFALGAQKQVQDFLISKDGKTLIRLTKIDMTKDPFAEIMKKIDVTGRPVRGGKDAKVVIVNYDDFQCPFCARMHQTLTSEILGTFGDKIKVVYKDYPLVEIHPWAKHAAVNANCLNQQKQDAYWAFADAIHANARMISQTKGVPEQFAQVDQLALEEGTKNGLDATALQGCIKAQDDFFVKASMREAESLKVEATPTLFINGQKLDGAVPAEELKAIINRALADAGQPISGPASQKPLGAGK